MTVMSNGRFITLPVVSISSNERTGEKVLDKFDVNVIADHIVGVNGIDGYSELVTEGAQSMILFDTEAGLRPMACMARAEEVLDILEVLTYKDFMAIDVVSVSEDPNTAEKFIKRFTGHVDFNLIVGINALDATTQQVTEDSRSIIYFKPKSGLRPTLSSEDANSLLARYNEICYA